MPAVEPAVVARALYDSLQATLRNEGAEDQFDAVVESFFELVRGSGPREAEVTSAVPLDPNKMRSFSNCARSMARPWTSGSSSTSRSLVD
jgi:hypothetical protein